VKGPARGRASASEGSEALQARAALQLERLRRQLRRGVEEARTRLPWITARELSRVLGHHEDYLSKVFRGKHRMTIRDVADILNYARIRPDDFFALLFPLGGPLETTLQMTQRMDVPALDLSDVEAVLGPQFPVRPGVEVERRAGEILRREIRRARRTQRALSLEIGLGSPHRLGQALRGESRLTFRHLLLVLAALGRSPGRFFLELFDPQNGPPGPGVAWDETLDEADRIGRETVLGLAEMRFWRGIHPPVEVEADEP